MLLKIGSLSLFDTIYTSEKFKILLCICNPGVKDVRDLQNEIYLPTHLFSPTATLNTLLLYKCMRNCFLCCLLGCRFQLHS